MYVHERKKKTLLFKHHIYPLSRTYILVETLLWHNAKLKTVNSKDFRRKIIYFVKYPFVFEVLFELCLNEKCHRYFLSNNQLRFLNNYLSWWKLYWLLQFLLVGTSMKSIFHYNKSKYLILILNKNTMPHTCWKVSVCSGSCNLV